MAELTMTDEYVAALNDSKVQEALLRDRAHRLSLIGSFVFGYYLPSGTSWLDSVQSWRASLIELIQREDLDDTYDFPLEHMSDYELIGRAFVAHMIGSK